MDNVMRKGQPRVISQREINQLVVKPQRIPELVQLLGRLLHHKQFEIASMKQALNEEAFISKIN